MNTDVIRVDSPVSSLPSEPGRTSSDSTAAVTAATGIEEGGTSTSEKILRFQKSERMLHWSIAIPFMVCYVTGVILLAFYNLHSPGISRAIFSWLHRISGVCLIAFPLLTAIRNRKDYGIHTYNIRQAWIWAIDDVKWLVLMGGAMISRRITLPEQGKFNAGEKLNFMMVMCTYPLFIVTGLILWLPGTAFLSWIIHVGLALIATPLMFGHIYMALINPDTRSGLSGMLSGYVERHWAKHHYGRWYRETFNEDEKSRGNRDEVR